MRASYAERIKDRIREGFGHYNNGYEDWLEWCNTLYEPDAHYNYYGRRFTLQEYKDNVGWLFSAFDVKLGGLDNMIVEGDWVAIRYSLEFTKKETGEKFVANNMEFVLFKDHPEPIGARCVEGWAITDNPLTDHLD